MTGIIVGSVVGGIFLLLVVALVAFLIIKNGKKTTERV